MVGSGAEIRNGCMINKLKYAETLKTDMMIHRHFERGAQSFSNHDANIVFKFAYLLSIHVLCLNCFLYWAWINVFLS